MKTAPLRCGTALASLLWLAPAAAHEVLQDITQTPAVVVSLHYADGSPFAYEAYELYPEGSELPAQVGRTDAAGRVVFLADDTAAWRLKAFSADGHGMDSRFTVPTTAPGPTPAGAAGLDRQTRLLVGAALLFGLFGLVQLYLRRRKSG